jgi:hypothetical protein
MSVVAAGARPIRGKAFPKTKGTLMVVAVALLALLAFAAFSAFHSGWARGQ